MARHVHAVIGFSNPGKTTNNIMSNRKRFIAYDLIKRLSAQHQHLILQELSNTLNKIRVKQNWLSWISNQSLYYFPMLIAQQVSLFPIAGYRY